MLMLDHNGNINSIKITAVLACCLTLVLFEMRNRRACRNGGEGGKSINIGGEGESRVATVPIFNGRISHIVQWRNCTQCSNA